jgi:hypothetical protein
MVGKIFITRSGYDPQVGKHIKDPYLGPCPTLGACRPDIRKKLQSGDHIFVISGRVPGFNQFVVGGFEIDSKIDASQAYKLFPEQRLRLREDGQLTGNIIVDANGTQHQLDSHDSFDRRIRNYVIGRSLISLVTPDEIADGRKQTLDALCEILQRKGETPVQVVTRFGKDLTERQVIQLREWLATIKGTIH